MGRLCCCPAVSWFYRTLLTLEFHFVPCFIYKRESPLPLRRLSASRINDARRFDDGYSLITSFTCTPQRLKILITTVKFFVLCIMHNDTSSTVPVYTAVQLRQNISIPCHFSKYQHQHSSAQSNHYAVSTIFSPIVTPLTPFLDSLSRDSYILTGTIIDPNSCSP